jgi:hypothetical protein
LIEAKIEAMTDVQRRILEAASVAGLRFAPATTARAAGLDEQSFEAICEEFSRNAYIIHRDELVALPDGDLVRAYSFNHAVYRDVFYDRLGQSRRTHLHCAIAQRIEEIYPAEGRTSVAVPLAQHFISDWAWPRGLGSMRSTRREALARPEQGDTPNAYPGGSLPFEPRYPSRARPCGVQSGGGPSPH